MPLLRGLVVLVICSIAGFFRLTDLPASWYGDISIVHEYVLSIRALDWPWYFSVSAGPLYHYLIAPGIVIPGPSYLSYKIMSVIMGLVGIWGVVLPGREILPRRWAYIAGVVTGTSFWWLAWERTGNSQILIATLSAYTGWLALAYGRTGDIRHFR